MRLSPKSMAITLAVLWGGGIFCVGAVNVAKPTYGLYFLQMMSSVYPWFHASRNLGDLAIGTIDGIVDGAVGGYVFAWLYNSFVSELGHE